jgi:hypothetical protein|nr:MAG TPA: hypothetical protein [Caudoviricetes sp.]
MKYAVEAKIFSNGKIVAKVRPARDGEESGCTETRSCDIWVDIFDDLGEAARYCADYRKA